MILARPVQVSNLRRGIRWDPYRVTSGTIVARPRQTPRTVREGSVPVAPSRHPRAGDGAVGAHPPVDEAPGLAVAAELVPIAAPVVHAALPHAHPAPTP